MKLMLEQLQPLTLSFRKLEVDLTVGLVPRRLVDGRRHVERRISEGGSLRLGRHPSIFPFERLSDRLGIVVIVCGGAAATDGETRSRNDQSGE